MTAAAARQPGLPLTLRLGMERARVELLQFYRTPELVVFTFLLPVLFVVIFSTVFSGRHRWTARPAGRVFAVFRGRDAGRRNCLNHVHQPGDDDLR